MNELNKSQIGFPLNLNKPKMKTSSCQTEKSLLPFKKKDSGIKFIYDLKSEVNILDSIILKKLTKKFKGEILFKDLLAKHGKKNCKSAFKDLKTFAVCIPEVGIILTKKSRDPYIFATIDEEIFKKSKIHI